MTDTASLVLSVNTTQVNAGAVSLDDLAAAGARAEAATNKMSDAVDKSQADWFAHRNTIDSTSKSLFTASDSVQKLLNKYDPLGTKLRSLEAEFDMLNKAAMGGQIGANNYDAVDKTYQALNAEISKTKALMTAAGVAGAEGFGAAAAGAEKSAFSTAQARRELIVLGHEAMTGNFSRMPGSFMVLAERIGLSGGALTSIILPIAAVGGAAYLMFKVFTDGTKELDAFNKALIMTGNMAGTTAGQMSDMARSMADGSITQGKASAALAEMAATGEVAGANLKQFTQVAIDMESTTGTKVADTVKHFAELGVEPVKASLKLNESLNYLTVSTLEQIKAAEELGNKEQAASLAQKALADALATRTTEIETNAGTMERAWLAVANAAKGAWDAMLGVGRKQTADEQLSAINARIAELQTMQANSGFASNGAGAAFGHASMGLDSKRAAELQSLQAQAAALGGVAYAADQAAKAQGAKAAADKAGVEAVMQVTAANDKALSKQEQMTKALGSYRAEIEKIRAADIANSKDPAMDKLLDPAQIAKTEAAIRKQYEVKTHTGVGTERQDAAAQAALDIDAIKREQSSINDIYAGAQKIIDAQHAAGILSDKDYYADKKALIDGIAQAQEDGLSKELAYLKAETFAGKNAVADRLKNAKQILDVEAQLAKMHDAAAVNAEVNSAKEIGATKASQKAWADAQTAAQSYLDTITRTQDRTLAGYGIGNQGRNYTAGYDHILDKYDQERRGYEKSKADALAINPDAYNPGTAAKKTFDDELALTYTSQAKLLASYDVYYANLLKKQSDWSLGAKEALQNYYDDSQNVYKQMDSLVSNAFKGMEDALVSFVTTGKGSVTDLFDSISAGVARMVIETQITGPLAQMINSSLGSGWLSSLIGGGASASAVASGSTSATNSALMSMFGNGMASFASGTDYVPNDMIAQIHQGERIVPAAQNNAANNQAQQPTVHVTQYFTVGDVATVSMVRQAVAGSEKRIAGAMGRSMRYGGAMA